MCFLFFNKTAQEELSSLANTGKNLFSEMTFKPYVSASFHACALFSSIGYLLRSVQHLLSLAVTLLTSPFLILTPWNLFSVPWIVLEQASNSILNAIAVIIQPCFFLLRTLTSLTLGYQQMPMIELNNREDQVEEPLLVPVI